MALRLGGLLILAALLAPAQQRDIERPARHAARGLRGAIAAGSPFATEAAMRIYHAGGNAVDAGVAATLAAAATEFSHFGLGGEAPILVRTRDGQIHALAGIGTMPKLATADFFRSRRAPAGEPLVPVSGILPALAPGMVESVLVALRDYGTKSFADVAQPAIELAEGFPIDETRCAAIERSRRIIDQWPTSRAIFLPEGRVPRPGDIFRQPDLARTLRAMADAEKQASGRARGIDAVRDFFYRGPIARHIDAFSRANQGLLRYEDMAAFRIEPEAPAATTYRGLTLYKPGFWSQGPALLEALNILESYDLRALHWNSAAYIHTVTEALKLAYADRDTFYGDPRFSEVPAARLLSKDYAAERRRLITDTASQDFRPGRIGANPPQHPSQMKTTAHAIDPALLARDTTCVDAIDKDGIVFSATPSGAWLPSVIAGDTGIPLTQRAQSFLLIPGHPNELASGKRPRITLSPTLVTQNGAPLLALSTPGGDNQDQSLLQVFLNVVEFGMGAQQAVEAPRFQTRHLVSSFDNHAMYPGDLLLDERTPEAVVEDLAHRGHHTSTRSRWSSGAAPVLIRVLPNQVLEAGADPCYYRQAEAW